MTRQILPASGAAKHGIRKLAAQAVHHGAVPHHNHFHAAIRELPLQAGIKAQNRNQVLFPGQAPHHSEYDFIPPDAPGLAQGNIPLSGIKQNGIHTAPHDGQPFKTKLTQGNKHFFRRYYGQSDLIVQFAQIIHGGILQT